MILEGAREGARLVPFHMDIEEETLEIVENETTTSIQSIANNVGVAPTKVCKTLRQEQFYPYQKV